MREANRSFKHTSTPGQERQSRPSTAGSSSRNMSPAPDVAPDAAAGDPEEMADDEIFLPPPSEEETEAALLRLGLPPTDADDWLRLRRLACSLRGVTDFDCRALAPVLSTRAHDCLATLTAIQLAHNCIGDAGARALARALACGAPRLGRLALHENRIGCPGLVALASAFATDGAPNLTLLRIGFNRVGDRGMAALAAAWEEGGGRELRELHAAGNCIGDAGLAKLASVLHATPALITLALGSAAGGNRIGEAGAHALCAALRMNAGRSLAVNLKGNPLSPRAWRELQETQRDCGVLGELRLDVDALPSPPASSRGRRPSASFDKVDASGLVVSHEPSMALMSDDI